MIYGYARVSSKGQAIYGQSLQVQEDELRQHGAETVFKDVFTGTAASRPQLDRLLSELKNGDTLIVSKCDRLGRTAENIIKLVRELVERGVSVNILNMGIANNTSTGRLMLTILSGFAEFEHDMILTRLQEGKEARKEQFPEYKEGRKEKPYNEERFKALSEEVAKGSMSVSEACRELGISRGHWYRLIKK